MNRLNTMFNFKSNIMCNNILFNSDKIDSMHKQMERLYQAAKVLKEITGQSELARALNASPQTVKNWESRGISNQGLLTAQKVIGCSAVWLETGNGSMGDNHITSASNAKSTAYKLESSIEPNEECYEIEYWDARGSCGGGALNGDSKPTGKMIKEASWFTKFNIKPRDAIVIKAFGDSMADFIVDGDMVIFNRSKTTPRSGGIFLIEHPDGLRIKQLRREIDGTWILESRNPDKRKFPDERLHPSQAELLIIKGEFVYRQGG